MMPYSALDIVNRMDASLSLARPKPAHLSFLVRLAILLTLVEIAVLWAVTGVLTS
jgi:hypothetical protein